MRLLRMSVILAISVLLAAMGTAAAPQQAVAATKVQQMKEHVALLRGYIQAYGSDHGAFPAASVVKKGGGLAAPVWPANPWTGAYLHAGSHVGDYVYTRSADRMSFSLKGRLASGSYTLKGYLPSPLAARRNDEITKTGLGLIQEYIEDWSLQNNDTYPQAGDVRPDGSIRLDWDVWPFDAWTAFSTAMSSGSSMGQYTYERAQDGLSYTLAGHLSNGTDYVLSGSEDNPLHRMRLELKDTIVKRDLDVIHGYVQLWARENNGVLPSANDLSPTGAVGQQHSDWPTDPYTWSELFTIGSGVGHFTYAPSLDGKSYVLSADLGGAEEPYEITESTPVISSWWRDQMVYSGVQTILRGIEQYTIDNSDVYPPASEVAPDGDVGTYVMAWPADPWGVPGTYMSNSSNEGDFTYTSGMEGFALSGHLSDGTDFTADNTWWTDRFLGMRQRNKDLIVQRSVQVIKDYVDAWKLTHSGALPTAEQLAADGAVGNAHTWWPVSPWTLWPMEAGTGMGDFQYAQDAGGYTLTVREAPFLDPKYGGAYPEYYQAQ